MMKSEYRPYQYIMQDISHVFVGSKFTLQNILDFEDTPFKLKSIVRKYFLETASLRGDTVLADYLYEVDEKSEAYDVLKRLKTKVKCNIPKDYSRDAGYRNVTMSYVDFLSNTELCEHREQIYIEEISISKLSMLALG